MSSDPTNAPQTCVPAFPGKILFLGADPYLPTAILTDCVFETIAGRTYLVGRDHSPVYTKGFPGGLRRYIAWDSDFARHVIVFDSVEDFQTWKNLPYPKDELPF